MVNQNTANDGTCDNSGCDEVTSWDMALIMFDGKWFCSPDCAREHLEEMDTAPQSITLHDPQFAVSRDELPPAVGKEDVDIQRPVTGMEDAFTAIQEIESMYPAKFRVVMDE